MRIYVSTVVLAAFGLLGACRQGGLYPDGEIGNDADRPEYGDADDIAPYAGDNPIVIEAQEEFPTALDFHQKVIWRTCTPFDGVCHNSKEYPDLRTPAGFISAFGAPCNLQFGEFQSVYDGCERTGDRITLNSGGFVEGEFEIGYIEYLPGESEGYDTTPADDAPGLHVHLASPVQNEQPEGYATADFSRKFVTEGVVEELVYDSFSTRWWVLGDGTHLVGEVRNYQVEQVQDVLSVGIVEGDANHNGTFGAKVYDEPAMLLEPGDPEGSYLIARLRGEMHGEEVPGSRMPLANKPFSIPEMLALFCLVEGYSEEAAATGLTLPIDYKNCSYTDDPEGLNLLGAGVTWEGRVRKILEFNCGGCHSGTDPADGLNLLEGDVFERLLEKSAHVPDLALIEPGDEMASYLYLKLIGDDSIIGQPMPYNPITGEGTLTQAEIDDVLTWIVNGAVENE